MCGRFVSTSTADEIARHFGARPVAPQLPGVHAVAESLLQPSWNVAPTRRIWIVRGGPEGRLLEQARWGLVPSWAKDPSVGQRMINARVETLDERPAYRAAYRRRRCVVPADGFYEWQPRPGERRKQPWYFTSQDGAPLAFAGLWEEWRRDEQQEAALVTCTIVTTEADATVGPVHDRMPLTLEGPAVDQWLAEGRLPEGILAALLGRTVRLRAHPVGQAVGNVSNDGPQLISPVETGGGNPAHGGRLFP